MSDFLVKQPVQRHFSPKGYPPTKGKIMSISDTLKTRLSKGRPMTSITLCIPVDVAESMKAFAPRRGVAGCQTLLNAYLSEGLSRDEAQFMFDPTTRLMAALKKHGVPQDALNKAARDLETA